MLIGYGLQLTRNLLMFWII